jgi:hypothetical protein
MLFRWPDGGGARRRRLICRCDAGREAQERERDSGGFNGIHRYTPSAKRLRRRLCSTVSVRGDSFCPVLA